MQDSISSNLLATASSLLARQVSLGRIQMEQAIGDIVGRFTGLHQRLSQAVAAPQQQGDMPGSGSSR